MASGCCGVLKSWRICQGWEAEWEDRSKNPKVMNITRRNQALFPLHAGLSMEIHFRHSGVFTVTSIGRSGETRTCHTNVHKEVYDYLFYP